MNVIKRGVRNAFRNVTRTGSIVLILSISIGLIIALLAARQAVEDKIATIKSTVGTTVSISPAGFNSFSQANNALTVSDLNSKVKSLAHVTGLTENLTGHLTTEGTTDRPTGANVIGPAASSSDVTSLKSPVKLNVNDATNDDGGPRLSILGGGKLPSNFAPPIEVLGTTDPSRISGNEAKITSGNLIDGTKDSNDAMISTDMASKNDLKIGSTFKAYGKTLTVAGIFDSGSQGGNNTVIVSLAALQRLSDQKDVVTSATATVDSLDNLSSVTSAVKDALGSDADVQSSQDEADNTVSPLENIASISLASLIGAVIAGAAIILLVMVMVVRERRREVGVMKAVGASNRSIIGQFSVEALTLTIMALVIGLGIGIAVAAPVTNALVDSSSSSDTTRDGPQTRTARGGGFAMRGAASFSRGFQAVEKIESSVGASTLLAAAGATLLIAVIGSALPAFMISKIKPAEAMRSE